METLLIIACVIGVFATALFYAIRSNTKRASMIQDFANTRGWAYARLDTQGLSAKIDSFFPDEAFKLDNIMIILTDAVQAVFVAHRQAPLFNPVRISLSSDGAVLLTGLNAEPERWQDIVDLARKIEASLP